MDCGKSSAVNLDFARVGVSAVGMDTILFRSGVTIFGNSAVLSAQYTGFMGKSKRSQ